MITHDPKNWVCILSEVPSRLPAREGYARLLTTFPGSLAAHQRQPGSVTGPDAPADVLTALHRRVHADIAHGHLASDARIALSPLLQQFADLTGACERIRNTPIPYRNSTDVQQFVLLSALILPFGLARDFGYGAVIASMLTFLATMGLERLAEEVEEPFGGDRNDLPLDDLAAIVRRDVHRAPGVGDRSADVTRIA